MPPLDLFRGSKAASDIAKNFTAPYEEERKFQRELQLNDIKSQSELDTYRKKKAIDVQSEQDQRNTLLQAIKSQSGGDGLPLKQYTIGGATYYNPKYSDEMNNLRVQATINKKVALGAGQEAGKMQLAKESITNVKNARQTLFPDGTPESFRRQVAFKSNIFGQPAPFSYEGQKISRELGSALAGRLLIQTGVASSPGEREQLVKNFMASAFSDSRNAHEALKQLEDFYSGYLNLADPSGMFHQQGSELDQTGSSGQPPSKSKYLVGQVLNIGGKSYRVIDNSDPNDPDLEQV